MKATVDNPIYSVYIVSGKKNKEKKYNITPAVTQITMSNQDKQLAQSVSITATNARVTDKKTLCQMLEVRMRVFVYANDGKKKDEVFRGWIWTEYHDTVLDKNELRFKCYDNLIYLQESEDSFYFSKGKRTKTIITTICKKWGIKLNYTYSSINHGKLPIKGALSNIIVSELLEKVRKRTGKKYVIESTKDVMNIKPEGSNKTVHRITKKHNATEVKWEKTMDGMVTKVKIYGTPKGKKKEKLMATVSGNTKTFGTLQKLQSKGSDEKLKTAKKEAQTTINDSGEPFEEFTVTAVDIPWIRKGDKVHVDAGHIVEKDLIVVGLERSITNDAKTMTLTLKRKGKM